MQTINEVQSALSKIIEKGISHSVFIWGPPGIGKSSIVRKVAKNNQLHLTDLRVSQLAPTDLRGLPYVEGGLAKFAPPSFLPRAGEGILFVDEFNMASPAMMGIAQQLILDRQVGDYKVPDGWFIFAAGNRASDRAAVNRMPSPVANRFIHFTVEPTLDSWKKYAIANGINEQIVAFLNYRPQLLFDFNKNQDAWASPRSWEFASSLLDIDLNISSCVGEGVASEFYAYQTIYSKLPDVEEILNGEDVDMPREPSLIYATIGAMVSRGKNAKHFANGLKWLLSKDITEDYTGLYLQDALISIDAGEMKAEFVKLISKDSKIREFFIKYAELLQ